MQAESDRENVNPGRVGTPLRRARELRARGALEDARQHCESYLDEAPHDAEGWILLGTVQSETARYDEAIASYRKALEIEPDSAAILNAIGLIHHKQRDYPKALEHYHQAHRLDGKNPLYPHNIGLIMHGLRKYEEAVQCHVAALTLAPTFADAFAGLGAALVDLGRFEEAELAFLRALKLKPEYVAAYLELSNCHLECGRFDAAVALLRQATERLPDDTMVRVSHAFLSNYLPNADEEAVFALHRNCAQRVQQDHVRGQPHTASREPLRKLRIGYVSNGFWRHPVGYFLLPVLNHHDVVQFETHAYSMTAKGDDLTHRLRGAFHRWHEVSGLGSQELAEKIRGDGIDILVDLSGYENWKQLGVFALKPAPVQVSWLGYWNTTGLDTMDYFISDEESSPPGCTQRFTEQLVRLPRTRFCYSPPGHAPEVAPLAAQRQGYVTFGSFNKIAKLNDGVVTLWSRVLAGVPGSRLLLKGKALNDEATRKGFMQRFGAHGIEAERLVLRGFSRDHRQMLEEYGDMDIALDPFPFSGALTTCEALWMGVPTVSMGGATLVSRQSVSLLKAVGLEGYCAQDEAGYVAAAVGAAQDLRSLAGVRAGLRERMRASPLCDGEGFTRHLETAFRKMWQSWCDSRSLTSRQ